MSPSDITSETLHRATLRLFILPGPSDETVVQLAEALISGARAVAPGPAAQFMGPDQVQYPRASGIRPSASCSRLALFEPVIQNDIPAFMHTKYRVFT